MRFESVAFLRGGSFDRTYIICDEAQNLTAIEMRMLVTRVGYKSKLVLCGDTSQTDLLSSNNGLQHLIGLLQK